jgi:hypothetical protein
VESLRTDCRQRCADRRSANDCIWRPQQVVPELVKRGRIKDAGLVSQCNEAYRLMLAANQTGEPLDDEGEILRPFRSTMHRVAVRLNQHSWEGLLATTDDFVVVAADTIGYWLAEDLQASVPGPKVSLLRQRGLWIDAG